LNEAGGKSSTGGEAEMDEVPTKILLATDGSEAATHASQAAIDLS
jgi:hypothetical protein